jgi:hypothetical protein
MSPMSRRKLFKQTSIGAASAGVFLAAPGFASIPSASAAQASTGPLPDEPLAAYVRNAASGEISLLIGRREIVFHDSELVRRLVQASL